MTATTPAEASFWAARAAVRGSPASSSTTSSTLLPLIPPLALVSSTSRLTMFFMSCPSEAHLPVNGHIRPILMSPARTSEGTSKATTPSKSPSFFIRYSPKGTSCCKRTAYPKTYKRKSPFLFPRPGRKGPSTTVATMEKKGLFCPSRHQGCGGRAEKHLLIVRPPWPWPPGYPW